MPLPAELTAPLVFRCFLCAEWLSAKDRRLQSEAKSQAHLQKVSELQQQMSTVRLQFGSSCVTQDGDACKILQLHWHTYL
jgi:hypothetical protein